MRHSTLILAAAVLATAPLISGEAHAQTKLRNCGTISSPGSYVLARNLTVPIAGDCLQVTASGVVINLNGFQIDGSGGLGGAGVAAGGGPTNVTVRNGTVTGFAGDGAGIVITGKGIVEGVHATNNGTGIAVGGGSMVADNIATGNTVGFVVGAGSTIRNNVAANNSDDGIRATGAPGSTLAHNTARLNGADGFEVECPSVLIGNASTDNTTNLNLIVTSGSCVSDNNATFP